MGKGQPSAPSCRLLLGVGLGNQIDLLLDAVHEQLPLLSSLDDINRNQAVPGRTENHVQGIGIPGLNRRFERVHCRLGGAEALLSRSQQAPGQHQQEGSEQ